MSANAKILPLDKAPRDGSRVFVVDDTGTIANAKWSGSFWAYNVPDPDYIEEVDFDPTGWVREPRDFLGRLDQ